MSHYRARIQERLVVEGRTDLDPRHVEGFMRLDWGTLDGLSEDVFADEVRISIACVDEGDPLQVEILARSFGLRPEVPS